MTMNRESTCAAKRSYDAILGDAERAQTCKRYHYCQRYHAAMAEWYDAPPDTEPCSICDAFDGRKRAISEGKAPRFLIVAIGTSRHYGGPEEGGWWYDTTEILEVRTAHTLSGGLAQARTLREEHPQPRYGRSSCANRGEPDVAICCFYGETDPRLPEETRGKPRYE